MVNPAQLRSFFNFICVSLLVWPIRNPQQDLPSPQQTSLTYAVYALYIPFLSRFSSRQLFLHGLSACLLVAASSVQGAVAVNLESDLSQLDNLKYEGLLKERAKKQPDLSSIGQVEWLGKELQSFLERHLQSEGYYQPSIEISAKIEPAARLRFKVKKGCQIRWKNVDIRLIHADKTVEKKAGYQDIKTGAGLNHSSYEKAASELLALQHRKGYLFAKWQEKKVLVKPESCSAEVKWAINLAKLAIVGDVSSNNSKLPSKLVSRMSGLKTGETLDPAGMTEARRSLLNTEWFQSMQLKLGEQDPTSGAIDIDIQYELAKPNVYEWSVGYNTDRGEVVNLGWQRRYLEGTGHGLSANYQYSGTGELYSGSYTIPRATEHEIAHYFTGSFETEDIDGLRTDSTTIDWRWALRHEGWRVTPGVGWQREISETDASKQTAQTLLMKLDANHQGLDDPLWPRSGHSLDLSFQAGPEGLLNEQDIARFSITAGYLIPLLERWSLQLRGKYGKVWADNTDDLPTDLRFFAGGDRSVRGYSYQELSPEDSSGTSIGGSEILVASIEPIYYFSNNWAAVAFYDVGSAYDDAPSTYPYGYGLGIRWRSPVGQIGLDIAQAEHPDYSDFRVHFRLGAAL